MNTTARTPARQTIARRVALIGFAIAFASMITLFIAGAVTGTAPMMVVASTTAAALSGSAAGTFAQLRKQARA